MSDEQLQLDSNCYRFAIEATDDYHLMKRSARYDTTRQKKMMSTSMPTLDNTKIDISGSIRDVRDLLNIFQRQCTVPVFHGDLVVTILSQDRASIRDRAFPSRLIVLAQFAVQRQVLRERKDESKGVSKSQ